MKIILITALLSLSNITVPPDISDDYIDKLHGQVYELLDTDLDSAMSVSEKTLQYSKDNDYIWGEGNSLFLKGYIFEQRNELGKSMIQYLKAVSVLEKLDTYKAINTRIKLIHNCGVILKDHYWYEEALEYFDKGIELANTHTLDKRLLEIYYNRSDAYRLQGSFDLAVQDAKACLNIAKKQQHSLFIARCWNILGVAYMEFGDQEKARGYYRKIIDSNIEKVATTRNKGRAFHNLGMTYYLDSNYIEAEKYYLKAQAEKEKRNRSRELFITYTDLAGVYQITGDFDRSLSIGKKAEGYYDDVLLLEKNYRLFHILGEVSHSLGMTSEGVAHTRRYVGENQKFLEKQKRILHEKDRFKMELVLAGYNQELNSNEKISNLSTWIISILIAIGVVLLFIRLKKLWLKRVLTSELKDTMNDIDLKDL